ncbi:acyltransferase family protein [Pedobacter alluvionis]|uniref:Acyltransferase n=1 Tax=Pedobacter alluvionis TaxID=475253 RepID=A0A497XW86_9SPHI|nr:acyltransferase [Pedobacter alluvionis]RLJ73904.1 peptidoglycan/LPS O-acetylase OafA/YrhL [Pedobacter alluvionis]TFB32489.1 acyltransferase [Pedobacter alluvionis]
MSGRLSTTKHLMFLDSLRGLASLYVVLHHAAAYFPFSHESSFKRIVLQILGYGHWAVDLFIVLSGYSLMLAAIRNDYAIKGGYFFFIKRRIIRIIPPYYLALFLSIILIYFFINDSNNQRWSYALPVTYETVIFHLMMIHDFLKSSVTKINYSFWSIGVEFRIYFFFPLLLLVLKKIGRLGVLGLALLVTIVCAVLMKYLEGINSDFDYIGIGVNHYILLFCFGMLIADLSFSTANLATRIRQIYFHYQNVINYSVLSIFLIFLMPGRTNLTNLITKSFDQSNKLFFNPRIEDLLVGIFTCFILFICSVNSAPKSYHLPKLLAWRPLTLLGTFSYSLYLIHAPILQIFVQYIISPLKLESFSKCLLLLFVGTPIILALSYLFFLCCEKPFLKMRTKQ